MSVTDLIRDMAEDTLRAQARATSPTYRDYEQMRASRDMTAQHARNCKVESELWALREIAARARLKRMDEELKARGWL